MNVHFLERSVSPLHHPEIFRGRDARQAMPLHDSFPNHPSTCSESPSRARPRGSLRPVNLHDTRFSLKRSFPDNNTDIMGASDSTGNITPHVEERGGRDHGSPSKHPFEGVHVNTDWRKGIGAQTQFQSTTETIPISRDSMMRTSSELQLQEDEALADYRDQCMYMRILNGMSEHHQSWNGDTIEAIRHIMQTRIQPVDQQPGPSSYVRESRIRHTITSPDTPKAKRTVKPSDAWDDWLPQARLRPPIDDPVSSLYNTSNQGDLDLDLSGRLSLLMTNSEEGSTTPGKEPNLTGDNHAPLPMYVPFRAYDIDVDDEALIDVDDEALFEMDGI